MHYVVITFLLLLSPGISQAQTLTIPSESSGKETQIQPCTNCSTALAFSNQPSGAVPRVRSGELPDAPSSSDSLEPVAWSLTELKQPEPAPRLDRVWDKKTWAAHIVLASSMIFDVEMTHEGIAHHRCEEGNSDLKAHPSRSELYLDNLEQFAPIVVMDWLGSATLRHGHLPRWAWKSIAYFGPVYGSTMHIKGGVEWYTRCW